MIRMKPIENATRAEAYYAQSDGGYYTGVDQLHTEWGGKGAIRLGLTKVPDFEEFKRLIHGLDAHSGEKLTARLNADRVAGWDITASVPKGVTVASERGDSRIHGLIWEANRRAMSDLQALATTRVRKGGQQEDRRTDNLVWYSVEHAETRPVLDESLPDGSPWREMPDMDRHIHNVVMNVTFDPVEQEWKAVKFRPIMDQRKYFDRRFDHWLARSLVEAGYELETKWEQQSRGGVAYRTWDIKGIPAAVIAQNSRRTAEIDALEQEIVAEARDKGGTFSHLSAVARDLLGGTSRRQKRDGLTLADCREFWDQRISPFDARAIAETIKRALRGENGRPEQTSANAVDFAFRHHFEQQSVVPFEQLAVTAMEHSLGAANPDEIEREAIHRGLIVREMDGRRLATLPELQREEEFIAGFARNGMGAVRPVGLIPELERGRLNDGQWKAVSGLLESPNRVAVVEGPAGAGKSSLLQKLDEGIKRAGQTVTYLASTAAAVEVLRRDGFEAETVARFLLDDQLQAASAGGRIVVDESSMLGHKDAVRLFQAAERRNLKLILMGDAAQLGSVPRGAFLRVVKQYGGIQPFKLSEIMRQRSPEYRAAASLLSEGNTLAGFDALDSLGWVREIAHSEDRYRHLAADYVQARRDGKSVLVVSPTHAESAVITQEIRRQLRDAGMLGKEEREFSRLVQVPVTEAERALPQTYRKGDVLVFHQHAKGGFAKGQRLVVSDLAAVPLHLAGRFSLYRPEPIALAVGDAIRFTGTVKTAGGKHTLKNGASHSVAGFSGGNIRLENGWLVPGDSGHFRHGFTETSFGAQGRTVDRVLIGMGAESFAATNQEAMYVAASRGRERMTLYTDAKDDLRDAIQKSSQKAVALDLRPAQPPNRWERWRRQLLRLRRLANYRRLVSEWDRQPERPITLSRGPATSAERLNRRQLERENGHGR